ncbi:MULTISPECIES: hypothetical protein [Pseudomonas]|uniref:Uncharacterized protein n=1 Tax=Pseudomonas helmanticensis TaxID=1471381 RepID=A0A4R7VUJ8_9PSED|nr:MULTISPECIES: hypothetical protein [Pseudomonas]MDD1001807.1 hypothetical protein [Pseudomonas sp. TNT2022 ID642]TDV53089.1 hypothetical protein EDF87_101158 [Pseudomonas helmanticensis]
MKTSDQKLEFAASDPTNKKHPNDSFTATLTPPRKYTGEHFEADWIECIPSAQDGYLLITGRYEEGGGDAYVGIQIIFQKDLPDGEHEVGPKGSAVSGNLAFVSSWSITTEILRAKKGKFHLQRIAHNSINATIDMEFEYNNETIKVSNGKVFVTNDTPI